MNIKRILSALAASLMVCALCTSCGDKKAKKTVDYEKKEISTDTADSDMADVSSGQAYLLIRDEKGGNQFTGKKSDNLSNNADVVSIAGNGSYTVGVSAGSGLSPKGIMCAAVMIKDGAAACPGAVITVDSIEVDGAEIPLSGKNFTFTEAGKDLKTNIFNEWVGEGNIPDGAVSAEGEVSKEAEGYSSVIVSKENFASWTTVKVNFTVSGM